MIILWIGLPILSILLYIWSPDTSGEMPFSILIATMMSSLGGSLAAIMITVQLIHEKSRHVYELFLVRPVKRKNLLLSKFLAVFLCVAIACALSLLAGLIIDYFQHGIILQESVKSTYQSFGLSLATIASWCAAGVLIGVFAPSVLVGVILIIFVVNNITSIALLLPMMMKESYAIAYSIMLSVMLTVIFLGLGIIIFNRKQF
jgi:ABC-type transport system involved in multi-copper enzyme maturation permease subunit